MKKTVFVLALLMAAAAVFAQKAGDKIQFSTKDLTGATVTDQRFSENRLTMINVWGTFCPPCIREMPDLAKLSEANKAKGVEVLGLVIDLTDRKGTVLEKQRKDADSIISQTGASYTHLVPTPAMMGGFLRGVQVVPTTIFVDKNGKQVGDAYMGARSQADWQKIIDSLLAKVQ